MCGVGEGVEGGRTGHAPNTGIPGHRPVKVTALLMMQSDSLSLSKEVDTREQ